MEQTRQLLERIGLEGQRLQMINLSSAMAGQFAFAAAELTAEVRRLGPSPVRAGARRAPPTGTNGPLRDGSRATEGSPEASD